MNITFSVDLSSTRVRFLKKFSQIDVERKMLIDGMVHIRQSDSHIEIPATYITRMCTSL